MKRKFRKLFLLLILILTPMVVLGVWFARAVRQQRLDRSLIAAIKKRDTVGVISLIDLGADANARDVPYKPITLRDKISELLSRLRGHSNAPIPNGYKTALMCVYGSIVYNFPDSDMLALFNAPPGTNPNKVDENRIAPSHMICTLVDHGAKFDAATASELLLYASMSDDAGAVRDLISRHANPNLIVKDDFIPLMCTSDYETMRALLDGGADPNERDQHGSTRVMYIEDNKLYPLLFSRGANPNIQDGDGRTALMYLFLRYFLTDSNIRFGSHFLMDHGARASTRDKGGFTALEYARGTKKHLYGIQGNHFDADVVRLLETAMKREQTLSRRGELTNPPER